MLQQNLFRVLEWVAAGGVVIFVDVLPEEILLVLVHNTSVSIVCTLFAERHLFWMTIFFRDSGSTHNAVQLVQHLHET